MKNKTIYRFMTALFTVALIFASCTKKMSEKKLDAILATSKVEAVKSDSATVVGYIVAAGDGFSEKGVCYNTDKIPTVDNNKVVYSGDDTKSTFNVVIPGLNYATVYYARAYAINSGGVVYGEEVTFTTKPVLATVTTLELTTITGNSAIGGGKVTVSGGAEVTARGVVYGLTQFPTIGDSSVASEKGMGDFAVTLAALKGNKTYYVRSYATNSVGTAYGNEVSFTTLIDLPVVTTTAVSELTKVSAKSGGNVTYDGGGTVSARGIVWGLTENPTVADNKIEGATGTGEFVSSIEGLLEFTAYNVRAYATNSAGTVYGDNVKFKTLSNILTWYIPGDYLEASYPGSAFANWAPDKSPFVRSSIAEPKKLEGYVYMVNSANSWKFTTQPNWDGPNYGDNGSGGLDATAGNVSSSAGYYKLNADATAMTYTAVATVWGVIGDATPNEWNDETALIFDPASSKWRGVIHLKNKEIKFRANHNWDYNYGSDAADGTLKSGAKNIPVSVEADYAIVLDLSTPNEYKYQINRWGIVGDLNAWGTDLDMTWDATNNVYTATTDIAVGELKFRANDAWDLNYGGDLNALTNGGANIAISEAGNYTITFDPWGLKATVTKN